MDPLRISGDLTSWGIEENFGVNGIMDVFEEASARAVFFVNVYEAQSFSPEYKHYMEQLLKELHKRGHEIGLHRHSVDEGSFFPHYSTPLNRLPLEKQRETIRAGLDYIYKHTGERPVSFRAGAYRVNDSTFQALSSEGILVDSSLRYLEERNVVSHWKTISQACSIGDIIEFPVVPVIDGKGRFTKLDFSQLSLTDLISTLDELCDRSDFPYVQIMFHSFSFLDTNAAGRVPIVSYRNGRDVYYGGNKKKKKELGTLLKYLNDNPCYEVTTFRELLMRSIHISALDKDGIAFAATETAKKEAALFSQNNYRDTDRDYIIHLPTPEDRIQQGITDFSYQVTDGHLIFEVNTDTALCKGFEYQFELGKRGFGYTYKTKRTTEPRCSFYGVGAGDWLIKYTVYYEGRSCVFYAKGIHLDCDLAPVFPKTMRGN